MKPGVRVFVAALRAGKGEHEALQDYCWAQCVVPISKSEAELRGDPFLCRANWRPGFASAMAIDALEAGLDDEAIGSAFEEGLKKDYDADLMFRTQMDNERPTTGDLVRGLSSEDRQTAAELLGYAFVAKALISR